MSKNALKIGTVETEISANGWEEVTLAFALSGVITRTQLKGFLSKVLDQPWLFKNTGKKKEKGKKKQQNSAGSKNPPDGKAAKAPSKKSIAKALRKEAIGILAEWAGVPDMSETSFADLRADPDEWNAAMQRKIGPEFYKIGADGEFAMSADERKTKIVEKLTVAGIADKHKSVTYALFPKITKHVPPAKTTNGSQEEKSADASA